MQQIRIYGLLASNVITPQQNLRKWALGTALLLLAGCQSRRPLQPTALAEPVRAPIIQSEQELAKTHGISPKELGFVVAHAASGKIVRSYQANALFIPASVTKAATSVAALELLGPSFRFETALRYTGVIEKGTLKGDLYLRGGGDPKLSVQQLMTLVEMARDKGIRRVEGHFYADASGVEDLSKLDGDFNSGAGYNAGVSGLSSGFNRFYAHWKVDPKNPELLRLHSTPQMPWHKFKMNELVEGETEPDFTFDDETGQFVLPKPVSQKGSESLPVKNPTLRTAFLFHQFALQNGIILSSPTVQKTPPKSRPLAKIQGETVLRLSEDVLEFSNNAIAELLFLRAARALAKAKVTHTDSGNHIRNWLKAKSPKTNWKGFQLKNGSGLTLGNRMTPNQALAILKITGKKRYNGRSFLSLLPISGWKGTLSRRMHEPQTAFRVWAKTGSLSFVSGLVGYFYSANNEKYAFAIFSTNRKLRERKTTEPKLKKQSKAWRRQSKLLENNLLSKWIDEL